MRISIRRCLSMLRNTGDGNELAIPLQCLAKVHSVGYVYCKVGGTAWLLATDSCYSAMSKNSNE